MNLLETYHSLLQDWRQVVSQKRTFERARRGELCSPPDFAISRRRPSQPPSTTRGFQPRCSAR